jgi:hypothetical protein
MRTHGGLASNSFVIQSNDKFYEINGDNNGSCERSAAGESVLFETRLSGDC